MSVGRVGKPRDYDSRASYAVYDVDKRRFEFKRVEYDIDLAVTKIFDLECHFGQRVFIAA